MYVCMYVRHNTSEFGEYDECASLRTEKVLAIEKSATNLELVLQLLVIKLACTSCTDEKPVQTSARIRAWCPNL